MAKANKNSRYFIKRGETEKIIKYNKEKLIIKLIIPTNKMHDEIMDEFTEIGVNKTVNVKAPDLIEERLIRYIIELPFEVPVTEKMDEYKKWSETTHEEKRIAIQLIDPELRDLINEQLAITSELSSEKVGN